MKYYLDNENYTMIKYFFSLTYFHINYFSSYTPYEWKNYLVEIAYDRFGNYQDNLRKAKIIKLVCDYIQNYTLIWDEFVRHIKLVSYDYFSNNNSLLCILVKLPKIKDILEKIKGSQTFLCENENNYYEVYANLIRYGTFETYQYLEPEILRSLQHMTLDNFENLLSLALCNKDIRILHKFYEIFESQKINREYLPELGELFFLKLPKLQDEQKIKRLKFLLPKFSLKTVRTKILDSNVIPYISNSLLKWILGKLYQNTFSEENVKYAEMINLLQEILCMEKKGRNKSKIQMIKNVIYKIKIKIM